MIRKADDSDFDGIWPIFHEIVNQGETYAFSPNTDRNEAFKIWMEIPTATYVAVDADKIVGTYYIKPNQPGLGAHFCNTGYMVSSPTRGRGIGRAMCEHSRWFYLETVSNITAMFPRSYEQFVITHLNFTDNTIVLL